MNMFDIFIRSFMALLSIGGLCIASLWILPQAHKFKPEACDEVSESKYSRFLRIPYAYMGAVYYFITLLAAITTWQIPVLTSFILAIIAVFFSIYLFVLLVTKLQSRCMPCYAAYVLNLLLCMSWLIILANL